MEVGDTLKKVLQEWLIPEFEKLHHELAEQRGRIDGISKRLDDINLHLADQSRRIDKVHSDLLVRIDETNKRIDKVHSDLLAHIEETNKGIDKVHDDLLARIEETNKRIDKVHGDLIARMDALREEYMDRIDATHDRIDTANQRLDQANALIGRLYEVIVRRDEHVGLERWVRELDSRLGSLERRLAA